MKAARTADNSSSRFDPRSRSTTFESRADIASVSRSEIADLTRDELVGLIRAADPPFLNMETRRRLPYLDASVLQRIAHLSCRCCRQQGY